MLKSRSIILLLLTSLSLAAQQQIEPGTPAKPKYFRNEEILYDGKRYRIHNNYLSFGPGVLNSSIRGNSQKSLGIDFQFHIRRQHFQTGVMMSGESYGSNNNIQAHFGYGYRIESKSYNLAVFGGPTYFTGVKEAYDTLRGTYPKFYTNYGAYLCLQGVMKITYDIGIGAELFTEYSKEQHLFGFRLIAFFSSAYAGPKRNYNPNVRAENPR